MNIQVRISTDVIIDGQSVGFVDTVTMRGLEMASSVLAAPWAFHKGWMPYIAIGSGLTLPTTEDNQLDNELWRKLSTVTKSGSTVIMTATFDNNEPSATATIREVGLLNALLGGVLGVRWVLEEDVSKSGNLEVICRITFQ